MSLPVWPSGVPFMPVVGTQQVSATTLAPISTEMNSGTTRRRRKYSLRIASMSFTLFLKNAEAAALQTFHETTLGDGSARFAMPLVWRGAVVTRTVQFAAQPAYAPIGPDRQKVSIALLVESLGT